MMIDYRSLLKVYLQANPKGTMAQEQGEKVLMLARADSAHMRLTSLILGALVQRGILSEAEAFKMVEDAKSVLPDGHPMQASFQDVLRQFRQ